MDYIIKKEKPFYVIGNQICIIRKKNYIDSNNYIKEYKIITTKGNITISLSKNHLINSIFEYNFKNINNIISRLENSKYFIFGSFDINLHDNNIIIKNDIGLYEYKKYDVLISKNDNKYDLVFCKERHYGNYGNPEVVLLGTVVSGYNNLLKLEKSDIIKQIVAIDNSNYENDIFNTADLDFKIKENDIIYTYATVELSMLSPIGSELLYSLTKNNTFLVTTKTNSYCSDDTFIGEPCEYENFDSRRRGCISIRTFGIGRSRVYIYLNNRTSSLAHSIIGMITKGIELFINSNKNSTITIKLYPEKINLIGKSLYDCINLLNKKNISFKVDTNNLNDSINNIENYYDYIVVSSYPSTTLEILSKKEVLLTITPKENILEVEFYYNKAPKTIDFFKHSINLKFKSIGSLNISMIYDSTFIFNSPIGAEKYKELMPENTPLNIVKSGDIGITNQSAKRVGYIGIRLEDNSLFGPTGEKFNATNIIGKVLNSDILKDKNENDIVYIIEK